MVEGQLAILDKLPSASSLEVENDETVQLQTSFGKELL